MEDRENGRGREEALGFTGDIPEGEGGGQAIDLARMQRGQPLFTLTPQQLGVLQKLATSITRDQADKDFLQVILTSVLDSADEAMRLTNAFTERLRYGVDLLPLIISLNAKSAVKGYSRVEKLIEALTHFRYYTNQRDTRRGANNRSPIT